MPVFVIIDPSLVHRAPLRAAALLAQSLGVGVEAIVVQNQDYANLASLPFVRELRVSSSQWGQFRSVEVVSGYGGQLRLIKQMILETARVFETEIQMRQVRGRIAVVSAQMQAQGAIVLVDRAPRIPVNQRRLYRQVIALVTDDSASAEVAATLAREHRVMLRVLVAQNKADDFAACRERITSALGKSAGNAQWLWQVLDASAPTANEQIMARLINLTAHTQSLVVLPAGDPACPTPRQLQRASAVTAIMVPSGLEIHAS
jgi:hypothetical protein